MTEIKNTMLSGKEPSTDQNRGIAKQIFHFAGSTKFKPLAVQATSREEAEKEWHKKREPVEAPVIKK